MLGKLIKHEFKATSKTFALLFSATIILSILTKFTDYMPHNNIILKLIIVIIAVSCVCCIFGGIIIAYVSMIRRYYESMMRDEGYLTHTLPVKMWQHITAKLVTDVTWMIASVVVSAVSLIIVLIGSRGFEKFIEGVNEFINIIGDNPRLIKYIVIIILLLITQFIVNLLCIFAAISLGQFFSKHKILAAVIFWCVLNYAMGIFTSIVTFLSSGLVAEIDELDRNLENATSITEYLDLLDQTMLNFFFVLMVIQVVMGVVYFVITNVMMQKKLNLE